MLNSNAIHLHEIFYFLTLSLEFSIDISPLDSFKMLSSFSKPDSESSYQLIEFYEFYKLVDFVCQLVLKDTFEH